MAGDSLAEMEQQNEGAPDGEMDMDEIQMAIQALSSLKGDPSSASPSSRPARPSEITLPPISTFWSGPPGVGSNGHAANGHSGTGPRHHVHSSNGLPGGLQYSYVTAGDGSGRFGTESNGHHRADMQGPSSSASTSAYTYTPATTPSVLTTTSLSSPGSPSGLDNSAYFRLEEDANDQAQFDLLESRHPTHTHTSMIVRANGQQGQQPGDDGFIGRVSQFPLVSGALRVYERGRNSSRVVKYGTDLMETSVKTISKPVINRVVGPNLVGQIDEFACRQLDRFGPKSGGSPRRTPMQDERLQGFDIEQPYRRHAVTQEDTGADASLALPQSREDMDSDSCPTPRTSSMPVQAFEMQSRPTDGVLSASRPGRSRWQSLVIEAGVTAGGIGAAVSEESMKSLKYCLHWLHYATAHLDHQVGILREFILSLSSHHRNDALMRSEDARAASILDGIKRDVVETIRKVVDVVSTYAGAALPEQAKRYVRSSILGLPEKWARAMHGQERAAIGETNGQEPAVAGRSGSEHTQSEDDVSTSDAPDSTQNAAERTLTFAVESLDMLRGVLGIFNDSVDRADAWVERLRLVGLQRQDASANDGTSNTANVQVSAVRSANGQITANGIRKREVEEAESFRRRKTSRKLDTDTEMYLEG